MTISMSDPDNKYSYYEEGQEKMVLYPFIRTDPQ